MAYMVVNSRYNPFTFDEMIKPFAMYGEAYREQEATIDAAREKEFSGSNLDQTLDKTAYDMYNSATNSLKGVADELATNGLSPELRGRIKSVARDYKTTMDALNDAQTRLYAEQDRRAKLGPDYVYQQNDLRIGDFLNGATPSRREESLSSITKDIAAQFSSRASQITSDTWDKLFARNGKVIGGYFDVTTQSGLTSAQLDTILSDERTWNSMMSNPTISSSQKELLQGFRDLISNKKDSIGYNGYDAYSRGKIDEAIVTGAHGALGTTSHKYQADKNFESPELRYRKQRDKIEDEEKEHQKKIERGEEPFLTDAEGNNYYKKGSVYWVTDKDGKQIQGPTTAGGLGKESGSGSKKEANLKDKLRKDKVFPLYFSAPGDARGKVRFQTNSTHFDPVSEHPVDIKELSPKHKEAINRKLSEYGLTIDQVSIYRDWDLLSRNNYKIELPYSDMELSMSEEEVEDKPRSQVSASSFFGIE